MFRLLLVFLRKGEVQVFIVCVCVMENNEHAQIDSFLFLFFSFPFVLQFLFWMIVKRSLLKLYFASVEGRREELYILFALSII
jgi:hypothetical protein